VSIFDKYPQKLLDQLGKASDYSLAKQFKLGKSTIKKLRILKKLPPFNPPGERISWTEEEDALLGKVPDTVIAKQKGIKKSVVGYRRQKLGIPVFVLDPLAEARPMAPPHQWTKAEEDLLGTMFDTQVAKILNIGASSVTAHRNKLGIKPKMSSDPIVWTRQMLRDLGQMPDKEFGDHYCMKSEAVKLKRMVYHIPRYGCAEPEPWPELPDEVFKLLGKMYDTELEKKYGIPRNTIRTVRVLHGIPTRERVWKTLHSWTQDDIALLGTDTDGNIARKLKIPRQQVSCRRTLLGIPAFKRTAKVNWTQDALDKLGVIPDHIIARQLGCIKRLVTEKRKSLGIEMKSQRFQWKDEDLALLGKVHDHELGTKLGISSTTVRMKRRSLSIPPLKKHPNIEWTPEILALLGTMSDHEIAIQMGSVTMIVKKNVSVLELNTITDTEEFGPKKKIETCWVPCSTARWQKYSG